MVSLWSFGWRPTNDAPWCAFGSVTLAFEWPAAVRGRPAAGSFQSRFSAVSGLLFSVHAIPLWGEKQVRRAHMGKSHRLAALLSAEAAAVSLSLGTATAAQATGLAPG